jgi:hypothetical protein
VRILGERTISYQRKTLSKELVNYSLKKNVQTVGSFIIKANAAPLSTDHPKANFTESSLLQKEQF